MEPKEKADQLKELFNNDINHAVKCAKELKELKKREGDSFMSEFWWDEVIEILSSLVKFTVELIGGKWFAFQRLKTDKKKKLIKSNMFDTKPEAEEQDRKNKEEFWK